MNSDVIGELTQSKEYREAFVAAHVRNGIAFQLRAMRNGRGWDQKELARVLGNEKLQSVVSRYENPDYGRFSVSTLLDLAKAFDVALMVRFAPFSELVNWDSNISTDSLDVPSFDEEISAKKVDFYRPKSTSMSYRRFVTQSINLDLAKLFITPPSLGVFAEATTETNTTDRLPIQKTSTGEELWRAIS